MQTAKLCGMRFLEPVTSHRMTFVPGYNEREAVEARARDHAVRLVRLLEVELGWSSTVR